MKVSLNWLKEYINISDNLTAKEICHKLTMTGSKVETIELFGKKVTNVVAGKVIEKKVHSDDSKACIIKVDIGESIKTVVAKIPDIQEGDIVPVALEGAKLATDKEVKVSEVMGIKSECMICHILDLGISMKDFAWCKSSGLITFPKDVVVGSDVNDILGLEDVIIEFEITPNRADCLSIEGIVKELSATLDINITKPMQREIGNIKETEATVEDVQGIKVDIKTDNCLRYMMRVGENIDIKHSSYDIQLKLIKCGLRPINNVVDVTNYVMLEMGQPLHAFDIEYVKGSKIIVRQSEMGETIETLDGINRTLDNQAMVISNASKPMAIAGIMGGELSGISDTTKKVVIEAASFYHGNIRYTSKRQSLRSDASSRYEKGIPAELASYAMRRVCELLEREAGAKIVEGVVDNYKRPMKQVSLEVDYNFINNFIGIDITKEEIDLILSKLDIVVENGIAKVPYYRTDIEIREDLAEEVARLYGLENIKPTLPNLSSVFGGKTSKQKSEDKVTNIMLSLGLSEAYNYTFVSGNSIERINLNEKSPLRNMIKISNPLSSEYEYMRTTMVPSMLEALERNYSKKNKEIKLFELGKVFLKKENIDMGKLGEEKLRISMGIIGKVDFYNLKGIIKELLSKFGIEENGIEYIRSEDEIYHPGISADIIIKNEKLGTFGKVSPLVIKNFNLPEDTYIADIDFELLMKYEDLKKIFSELPKYPAVERDIAITVNKDTLTTEIEKVITSSSEYVEKVKLFDVYQGSQIEEGMKSMAYEITLRSLNKTLNEQEAVNIMTDIINNLENRFGAKIRK